MFFFTLVNWFKMFFYVCLLRVTINHKFHIWSFYSLHELSQHVGSNCVLSDICSHKAHICIVAFLHELIQGLRLCFFNLALTDTNKQVKFGLKNVLAPWDVDIFETTACSFLNEWYTPSMVQFAKISFSLVNFEFCKIFGTICMQ